MSQQIFTGIDPTATSGTQLATILGQFKDAVVSGFSGTTRPSSLQAGGYWIDTSQAASPTFIWAFKLWTGSTDVVIFNINISSGSVTFPGTSSNFSVTRVSDDAVGAILKLAKARIANSGQVIMGDVIGETDYVSTTDGALVPIVASVKVVATETHTSSTQGTAMIFSNMKTGTTTFTEVMRVMNNRLGIGAVNPQAHLHVTSITGIRNERVQDDAVGAIFVQRKARVTGTGATQSADVISTYNSNSTDSVSSEFTAAQIEVAATENHTSTSRGTKMTLRTTKVGTNTMLDQMRLGDLGVEVIQPLTINAEIRATLQVPSAASIIALAATAPIVNITGSAATTLSGIDSTGPSKTILVHNSSSGLLTVNSGDTAAVAANRFLLPAGKSIVLTQYSSVEFFYSAIDAAWKLKSGSGSGGSVSVVTTQTVTSTGTIATSTTDTKQIRYVAGTSGQTTVSPTPFGTAGGWTDGTEITLIGTDSTNTVILTLNDATSGLVGNFTQVELGKYDNITFIYSALLTRWIQKN